MNGVVEYHPAIPDKLCQDKPRIEILAAAQGICASRPVNLCFNVSNCDEEEAISDEREYSGWC